MTDAQKIDFLAGQVSSLMAFVSAVIRPSINQEALRAEYARAAEVHATAALNLAVSEALLKGSEQTRADIDKLFTAAALAKGT